MTGGAAQLGRQIERQQRGEDSPYARPAKLAKQRDDDGFAIIEGEPVTLGGDKWYVERISGPRAAIEDGDLKLVIPDRSDDEAVLIGEMIERFEPEPGGARLPNAVPGWRLLAYALRLQYEISDGLLVELLNDDQAATNAAIVRVFELRVTPDERADYYETFLRRIIDAMPGMIERVASEALDNDGANRRSGTLPGPNGSNDPGNDPLPHGN